MRARDRVRALAWWALVAVPLPIAFATTYVAAHGSPVPIPVLATVAGVMLGGAVWLALRRHRLLGGGTIATTLALGVFVHSFCAAPLPAPSPLAGPLPQASPPAEMAVFGMVTGVNLRTAAFGYRGGSFSDEREFSMGAVLVKHPRGDLLIDTGFGRDIDRQFVEDMPWSFRLMTTYTRVSPAIDQLAAAGYPPTRLSKILLTHAHWDHVSGATDFPDLPVLVTAEERAFVDGGGWLTAFARRVAPARYQTYALDGPPYLGFPRSHDLHGDGSIVIVPAPGHTPGSVIVFLALPGGARYALVGDLAWQREGITEREERPWIVRRDADADPAAVRENLLRMAAVHARFPEIVLVPTHDARAMAALPPLR